MDLMEQIRLEAEKYADDCKAQTNANWWEVGDAFQSGAQALLNLLGRSATSEGHPPRFWASPAGATVWLEKPVNFNEHGFPDPIEYLSTEEHQALRAADLLLIESVKRAVDRNGARAAKYHEELLAERARNARLTEELEKWKWEYDNLCKFATDFEDQLAAEREARKGDSAEVARLESQLKTWEGRCDRLTAALEKIANGGIPNGEVGTVEDRMIAMCDIAMKALAEAGKPEEPHPRGYR